MRVIGWLLLGLWLSACTDTPQGHDTVLRGTAFIKAPEVGNVVYSETITITGEARGVPDGMLRVVIRDAENGVLVDVPVNVYDDGWSVEVLHTWQGEPTMFTIGVEAQNRRISDIYDERTVLLSGPDYRPGGLYGVILMPLDGTEVGGDSLAVLGHVSGVRMEDLRLAMDVEGRHEGDIVIPEGMQTSLLDMVTWHAEVNLEGVHGLVGLQLRHAGDGTELDRIEVMVGDTAG